MKQLDQNQTRDLSKIICLSILTAPSVAATKEGETLDSHQSIQHYS